MQIDEILRLAFKLGVSDVHFTVNSATAFRLHGHLRPFDAPEWAGRLEIDPSYIRVLTPEDTDNLARQIIIPERYKEYMATGELDFSYAIEGVGRFRVNAYKQQGNVALAIRLINSRILSFAELGLPEILAYLSRRPRGMVLVTGPTGSGKSTTLASMIDLINNERYDHILTLEDPIEFVHSHKKCRVNQRQIGLDSKSFASALRAAMREDPDVILVGEMRDPETIGIALTAAETGHLVFGTLHTSSAAQTIDRIIDVFPPHQQQQIRVQLANTIQGVVAQQLIPRIDKPGRVAAIEIMVATPAIRNLVREGKTYQIISQIQTGAKFGMQSLDMSLRNLYQKKMISKQEALNRAADPESLQKMIAD
ncbi:MAG: type IV pilus twitching motility protein PilT [Desulforudis sp.]|jgi:twitching motility protein PilT|nr:type IV pilus twitching motility protein PilT [Clostridia bacterium]MDQ7791722.1 type IV pilus twitching motility protein PilT [Clostridia bacterium]RJX22883.1 MAG: type IV pilus twitching motility protein PilT [Desulforudis sp.]